MSDTIPRNRGAALLSQWLEDHPVKHSELAAEIGVSRSTVSRYAGGRTLPTRQPAIDLYRICGIPLTAWDQPV